MTLPVVFADAAREELAELVEYLGPRNPRALPLPAALEPPLA